MPFFSFSFRNRKSRSRSRSPRDRDWKKSERRQDRDHGGRSSRGHGMREKDAKVRLYVSNIPYDIRWQDLKDVFREKGMLMFSYCTRYFASC